MEPSPSHVDLKREASADYIIDEPKCQKLSSSSPKFMVCIEISSPDFFSVNPLPVGSHTFPGESDCFNKLLPNIRCLKEHVLMQLPPIRRQIIDLVLKKSDIDSAIAVCSMTNDDDSIGKDAEDGPSEEDAGHNSPKLPSQVIGIAKLSGFRKWLLMHPIIAKSDDEIFESSQSFQKMIIFIHYHKVTDRLKVKIALVGILAGSSGPDLSAAQNVVFLELPDRISDFPQTCLKVKQLDLFVHIQQTTHFDPLPGTQAFKFATSSFVKRIGCWSSILEAG